MHCIQIVALLPAPVNFLPDAMALASNYVRPQEATACLGCPHLMPPLNAAPHPLA